MCLCVSSISSSALWQAEGRHILPNDQKRRGGSVVVTSGEGSAERGSHVTGGILPLLMRACMRASSATSGTEGLPDVRDRSAEGQGLALAERRLGMGTEGDEASCCTHGLVDTIGAAGTERIGDKSVQLPCTMWRALERVQTHAATLSRECVSNEEWPFTYVVLSFAWREQRCGGAEEVPMNRN